MLGSVGLALADVLNATHILSAEANPTVAKIILKCSVLR